MKASIQFRDDDRPLLRAKVPVGVLGLPFLSGLAAGGPSRRRRRPEPTSPYHEL